MMVGASGCASTRDAAAPRAEANSNNDVQDAASEAARQPLRDIGLMRREIPNALARISDPYAEPSGPGCSWLKYELNQLDAALGGEVAVMPVETQETVGERSGRAASTATRNMIRSAGNSLMPARSVIRFLSGAEDADALYEAATERGKVRRGYLKGLSEARNCS
ncbi:MAG: hypothetical protein HC777_01005 [Hyphomonadaceae bacterium]|nr:hypothetical protein [Hyphomonadaceae bacterium]